MKRRSSGGCIRECMQSWGGFMPKGKVYAGGACRRGGGKKGYYTAVLNKKLKNAQKICHYLLLLKAKKKVVQKVGMLEGWEVGR